MGSDKQAEILPHPWCNFCEEFFFNDMAFFDHLHRKHHTCHLCGENFKNIYYHEYSNLENHFALSHFQCPYEVCKAKCYVAFKTEEELKAHLDIEHKSKEKVINANSLLSFQLNDDEQDSYSAKRGGKFAKKKNHKDKEEAFTIKDSEGTDFSFYFSDQYNLIHEKKRKAIQHKKQMRAGKEEASRSQASAGLVIKKAGQDEVK